MKQLLQTLPKVPEVKEFTEFNRAKNDNGQIKVPQKWDFTPDDVQNPQDLSVKPAEQSVKVPAKFDKNDTTEVPVPSKVLQETQLADLIFKKMLKEEDPSPEKSPQSWQLIFALSLLLALIIFITCCLCNSECGILCCGRGKQYSQIIKEEQSSLREEVSMEKLEEDEEVPVLKRDDRLMLIIATCEIVRPMPLTFGDAP